MGTSQKYSLRWNDFSINVATTFRDLHSRQDFVDVTLACSDGSTLGAHKVILSSVSTYFRDILKTAECKHPILILKDTGRDEASAMLEFAYTGEVNVGQELLPSLLHTARCFKIKGLDNVQTPPGLIDLNTSHSNDSDHWGSSRPPTRPQTPSTRPPSPITRSHTPSPPSHSPTSVQSNQDTQDLKFFVNDQNHHASEASHQQQQGHGQLPLKGKLLPHPGGASEQQQHPVQHPLLSHAPPQGIPHVQPSHQQSQPSSTQQQHQDIKPFVTADGKIFPPVNDVKPSFSEHFLAGATNGHHSLPPLSGLHRMPRSQPATRPSSPLNSRTPPPKRWKRSFDMAHGGDDMIEENGLGPMEFRDAKRFSTDSNGVDRRCMEADSVNGGNIAAVAARRFIEPRPMASYPHSTPASPTRMDSRNLNSLGLLRHLARLEHQPREAHENSRVDANSRLQSMEDGLSQDALDYRFQTTEQSEALSKKDKERQERLAFRPESAPTVLDMSPEATRLSMDGFPKHEPLDGMAGFRNLVGIQPVSSAGDLDCLNKSLGSSGMDGGPGRYTCDECGKLFRHPGSLQHHRHIHRGTHRCPSCGKAFSRRWDMERHLNKSKYGCPANRFGSSPSPSHPGSGGSHSLANSPIQGLQVGPPVGGGASAHHLLAMIPHSTQTNSL